MTQERIAAVYQELETMRVPLDRSSVRGATYLLEKLQECRRYQDRLLTLSSEVERELSSAKQAARAWRMRLALEGPSVLKEANQAQDLLDELRGLERSLTYARQGMKVTDSDIRLASGLVDLQFKLGEVRPPEAPDKVAEKPIQEFVQAAFVDTKVPAALPVEVAAPLAVEPPGETAPVDDIAAFLREVR